jgi:hypothetical protein
LDLFSSLFHTVTIGLAPGVAHLVVGLR